MILHPSALTIRDQPTRFVKLFTATMPEAPIQTIGTVRKALGGSVFRVELPNGKLVVGHLPRRAAALAASLAPGRRVRLEMTPYDFEKARIAGLAAPDHE